MSLNTIAHAIRRDSFAVRREVVTELFADFADNRWTADETNSFTRYYGLLHAGS